MIRSGTERDALGLPGEIQICLGYPDENTAKISQLAGAPATKQAVIYARVSSREQDKEGFSIPAQLKPLREYAAALDLKVVQDYVDVETAKQTGRAAFGEMVAYLKAHPAVRILLVEKTDRLYRNLKDWVTVDELEVEIHFPKKASCCRADRAPRKSSCTASRC